MGKHTPGPWSWHGVELLSTGYFVLACTQHGRPERRDASLIAAAPELLEALKDAVCALEVCGRNFDHVMGKSRAAIAKATGE